VDRHLLPTGWVELPVTGVYEVHDGLITVYRDYFDLATIQSKWPSWGAAARTAHLGPVET
jgi:limonene-1,2-epoxide hydrolase